MIAKTGRAINTRKLGMGILVSLVLLELALRLYSHTVLNRPFWDDRKYVPDKDIIWLLNPNYQGVWTPLFKHFEVNSSGLIGPELSKPKGADVIRLIMIGGSVTFGYGTNHPDCTSFARLARLIQENARGGKYEVLNASAPGYSSYNGLKFAQHRLKALDADVFLIAFGGNDLAHDVAPDKTPHKDWSVSDMAIRGALTYSYTLQFEEAARLTLKSRFSRTRRNIFKSEYPFRVPLDDFRYNLTEIVKTWRELGVKPLLLNEPHPYGANDETGKIALHEQYQAIIREVAKDLTVPLADADSVFRQGNSLEYYPHPEEQFWYPSLQGQQVMAEVIYATLKEAGYLEK